MTGWRMYQLWYSRGGHLEPGPKFRLLRDALAHGRGVGQPHSFAVRTPEGAWHRDAATERSIFDRSGDQPDQHAGKDASGQPAAQGAVPVPMGAAEPTQAFGSGSKQHQVSEQPHVSLQPHVSPEHRVHEERSRTPESGDDEATDVGWPPVTPTA